jgi:hypothetical protein
MAVVFRSMPANKLKPPLRVGRYTYDGVVSEITRAIRRGGRGTHAKLAAALGLQSQQLSHRLAGTYARFSLEDFGIIADYMAATQGPHGYGRGWPFLTYEESLSLWGSH